jgi:hypothetical protein
MFHIMPFAKIIGLVDNNRTKSELSQILIVLTFEVFAP